MSHRLFEAVKRTSKQKGAARMLLLILADCQNDKTGICNPSVETLAQWCNTTVRNVRILIQGLVQDGELTVNKGGGRGNASTFTVNALGVVKSEEAFTVSSPKNSEEDFSEKEFTEKENSEKSGTETVKDSSVNSEKSCRVYKEEPKEPNRTVSLPVADAPDAAPALPGFEVNAPAELVSAPTSPEPTQQVSGVAEKAKKVSRKKSEKPRDARLDHPAVIAYRDVAHLCAPEFARDELIKAVGDDSARVEAWRAHVKDCLMKGWRPQNLKAMLETFAKSKPVLKIVSSQPSAPLPAEQREKLEAMFNRPESAHEYNARLYGKAVNQ